MEIAGQTAFVTGANRGIGRRFVEELLARGVHQVYAGVRDPERADEALRADPRVTLVRLDITDRASVEAAARQAGDVALLVNNAGISVSAPLLDGPLDTTRRTLDTNLYGTLDMTRAFAPALRAHRGALVNILSALSWFTVPGSGAYAVSKAGAWAMTNTLRLELAPAGVLVQGVHLGAADTDMMGDYEGPKIDPAEVARQSLDGVEKGEIEILADDWSRTVKAALPGEPNAVLSHLLG
ncbi:MULTISPECIES: SDR family oxidoreductase [unclassified Streptomyces]|uniref:SDR family oxidoreductase n=1 Tax=unclassified Streptomyces TaxID=2593676 RepID=UPI00081D6A4E|nr:MULTISPECIES: SDR family oxidoreductase [unclassified Streptomyces]MYR30202.1 SDR family NAD(P)-dependent oxidoreductase [Streptomyces sp. SID4945]SCF48976.1 Short-chain dehydrogenase [Streptomyces sp. LcepLS]